MTPILELRQVEKYYGDFAALQNITFNVPKGAIFGLLGPNGAGKTSLIRIITTITGADTGTVLLDGEPLNPEHIKITGYLPEERGLYKGMKVGEQLMYLAQLKGLTQRDAHQRIKNWLEKFEIESWWGKKIEELSKGMQQKVQFISTVLHEPKLLILDEPFSGLDPINANLIRDEIAALNERGTTIIFSTHRMEQVEEICEEIVLINKGQIILEGAVRNLKQNFKAHQFRIEFAEAAPADFQLPLDWQEVDRSRYTITFQGKDDSSLPHLFNALQQNRHEVLKVEELLPSLNEIFIQHVQNSNNHE